jgi:hypothetical protein
MGTRPSLTCRKSIVGNADSHGAGRPLIDRPPCWQRHLQARISVFITKLVHCAADVCKWHLTDTLSALPNVRFRG